jgi:hypothetical protein
MFRELSKKILSGVIVEGLPAPIVLLQHVDLQVAGDVYYLQHVDLAIARRRNETGAQRVPCKNTLIEAGGDGSEERVAMIQTNLALCNEGKVGETDRALILTLLFRSAADGIIKDEGIESPIVGLLAKGIEKINSAPLAAGARRYQQFTLKLHTAPVIRFLWSRQSRPRHSYRSIQAATEVAKTIAAARIMRLSVGMLPPKIVAVRHSLDAPTRQARHSTLAST